MFLKGFKKSGPGEGSKLILYTLQWLLVKIYQRVYDILSIKVQFFNIEAQNSTINIYVLSSILKVLKEIQNREKTLQYSKKPFI